jgi:hypothetical protein
MPVKRTAHEKCELSAKHQTRQRTFTLGCPLASSLLPGLHHVRAPFIANNSW